MIKTLVEAVLENGEKNPEKAAVCFRDQILTYRELGRKMKNAAVILQNLGVKARDRIMISAPSSPEYVIALLGVQYLGAASVPVEKAGQPENLTDIYDTVGCTLFITDMTGLPDHIRCYSLAELCRKAENEDADIAYGCPDEEDICEMLFTTGTTGKPKGVMLLYRSITESMWNTWHGMEMESSDVVLIPLPLNHSFGMRVLRASLRIGATAVLQNGFTFASEIDKNIKEHHCTAMICVPASFEILKRQMQDKLPAILGQLRYIEFGAGSLSYSVKKQIIQQLPNTKIFNTWGSSETGGALFLNISRNPEKLTSIGKAPDNIQIKIIDESGSPMVHTDKDHTGRLALKGKMIMGGYWQRPDLTAETIVDGWLYTNDVVYQDADGYVYMLGRADDIINVGGEKVSPVEVENIASEYEQIRECACIGIPDEEQILGAVPALFIVTDLDREAFDQAGLLRFLRKRMERYKIPQKIYFIEEIPRNRMQKLDRRALLRLWESM